MHAYICTKLDTETRSELLEIVLFSDITFKKIKDGGPLTY